jgi:signal transduction histidine kinase
LQLKAVGNLNQMWHSDCTASKRSEDAMRLGPVHAKLGTRLGLSTSAAILVVSLAFFGSKYVSDTRVQTDQLHRHMGENLAALGACLQNQPRPEGLQSTLDGFRKAFEAHVHAFGHHAHAAHRIAVLDERGHVLASTDHRWIGQTPPSALDEALLLRPPTSQDRFKTVLLEGERFLVLAERLGTRRVLYLEPYESVQEIARGSLLRNLGFSLLSALILAAAVNLLVGRLVTRRLELLARTMEQVEREGLQVPIPPLGHDELGDVRDVYAKTIAELQRSRLQIEEHARTLEQQVQERTEQLVRAHRLAAVGELAAGIAHGLNNPLASAAASAEKLLDLQERDRAELDKRLPDHLRRILRNTDRCKHITQSLLSFARESRFSPRPVAPAAVLREAAAVLEPEAESRGIALEVHADDPMPLVVADPEALTQVLVNLLSNALDASPAGSAVTMQATAGDNELCLSVTDRGTGIPAEDLERVFRPFYTTKPPGQGTGLGLSVAQGIVEQLGGHIVLHSRPGEGSRFEVRLPLELRP